MSPLAASPSAAIEASQRHQRAQLRRSLAEDGELISGDRVLIRLEDEHDRADDLPRIRQAEDDHRAQSVDRGVEHAVCEGRRGPRVAVGQNVGKARAIHGRFMNRVRDHAPVHIEQDEPPGDGLGEVLHRVVQVDRGAHVATLNSISYTVSNFSRKSS